MSMSRPRIYENDLDDPGQLFRIYENDHDENCHDASGQFSYTIYENCLDASGPFSYLRELPRRRWPVLVFTRMALMAVANSRAYENGLDDYVSFSYLRERP